MIRKFLARFKRTPQVEPQIFGSDDETQLIEAYPRPYEHFIYGSEETHRYAASAWARRNSPIYLELAGDNDPLAEAREAGRLPIYTFPILDPNDPLAGPSFRSEALAA